jgi:GT2 family glycosyltransferase
MTVSVVIPTCDRPDLLRRAVASVLEQSLAPSEVIVVDNGIEPVPRSWLPASLVVLRTPPRIGMSRARNVGAMAARGRSIAFLDDDDTWDQNYLARMVAAFSEGDNAVAVGAIVRVNAAGRHLSTTIFPSDDAAQRALYYRNPGFGGCNFLMDRAAFLELGGFDERFPASEDRDFGVRLLRAGYSLVSVPDSRVFALEYRGPRSAPHHLRGNAMFLRKHWPAMTGYERWQCIRRIAGRARNRLLEMLKAPIRRLLRLT